MRILKYPEDTKLLRTPGEPVSMEEVNTEAFQIKLKYMKKLLTLDGVGLAATQVGWSLQLFILSVDKHMNTIEPIVYLNPKILTRGKKRVKDSEGCLSFPDLSLEISRPKLIEWSYTTLAGEEVKAKSRGYYARAIQHEIDHLNGRLFIEKASPAQLTKLKKWIRKNKDS